LVIPITSRNGEITGRPYSPKKAIMHGMAGVEEDQLLSGRCFLTETVKAWGQYLRQDPDREAIAGVIKATKIGRPCGKEDFVSQIEGLLNRRFTARPRGRPRKKEEEREK
jgi:hypothetical protein